MKGRWNCWSQRLEITWPHCGHATGDRFELYICTFCTTSSDPESDFKAGRMKSWRSPPAWEIFARDKVSVEIPVAFPGSKSISSYMRGATIVASSEIQYLEQAHLLHLQQSQLLSLGLRPGLCPLFSPLHMRPSTVHVHAGFEVLSWRYFQSVDERKTDLVHYIVLSVSETG